MRIIQLASFTGNWGDNYSHFAFRKWFSDLYESDISWHELEIRNFYKKERFFDVDLADYINDFDLFVIGGGNFLELWVNSSPNGTSLSFSESFQDKINIPILFNSLGVDNGQGVSKSATDNFGNFISFFNEKKKSLFSLRNDGAKANIQCEFPEIDITKFIEIPDHGFFVKDYLKINQVEVNKCLIGINLANDMPNIRWPSTGEVSEDIYFHNIALQLNKIHQEFPESHFVFFCHMFRDFTPTAKVLNELDDSIRRNNVTIQHFENNLETALQAFVQYSSLTLMIAMRFHACVIPISLNIPTIGLCTYPQIKKVFNDLRLDQYCIDNSKGDSLEGLHTLTAEILAERPHICRQLDEINSLLLSRRFSAGNNVTEWLKKVL